MQSQWKLQVCTAAHPQTLEDWLIPCALSNGNKKGDNANILLRSGSKAAKELSMGEKKTFSPHDLGMPQRG